MIENYCNMVIIIDKNTENLCYIPKNVKVFPEQFKMEIQGISETKIVEVQDEGHFNNWYSFPIDFSAYQNGEYNYKLFADDKIVSYGIIQIGDYTQPHKDYNKQTTFKQYNPN